VELQACMPRMQLARATNLWGQQLTEKVRQEACITEPSDRFCATMINDRVLTHPRTEFCSMVVKRLRSW